MESKLKIFMQPFSTKCFFVLITQNNKWFFLVEFLNTIDINFLISSSHLKADFAMQIIVCNSIVQYTVDWLYDSSQNLCNYSENTPP